MKKNSKYITLIFSGLIIYCCSNFNYDTRIIESTPIYSADHLVGNYLMGNGLSRWYVLNIKRENNYDFISGSDNGLTNNSSGKIIYEKDSLKLIPKYDDIKDTTINIDAIEFPTSLNFNVYKFRGNTYLVPVQIKKWFENLISKNNEMSISDKTDIRLKIYTKNEKIK